MLVVLLIALFMLRGLILLCVYPPLEGFDEHKHLAYVAHVAETKTIPVYEKSHIPASLLADLPRVPHSWYGASELQSIGAVDYTRFWNAAPTEPQADVAKLIPLKAAFHPPG